MRYSPQHLTSLAVVTLGLLLLTGAILPATDADRTQANSYDNAWKTAWVTHLRTIKTAQSSTHTDGFVIHIGDSITYANQYANHFAAAGPHTDATDTTIIAWSKAGVADTSTPLPNSKNGWNLAKYDHPAGGRSFTASSGITSGQWLVGGGSHGMASGDGATADPTPMDTLLANNTTAPYPSGSTVAIVKDATAAIILLGTNDILQSVATATTTANLQSIINKLEAANIMVILSTIPPNANQDPTAVNTAIRSLAQSNNLPLIDLYAEMLRRRPGTTWQNTLIQGDGTHPSFGTGAYIDPDLDATVLDNDGYELRGFLSIQKLAEVKSYVIDGNTPPGSGPTITTQPANRSVALGGSQSLTVAATGTGALSYQWFKVGTGNVGTNSSTYTVNPAAASDDADYRVTVTDSTGSTVSNTVHLTVNIPAPTITTQPTNQTVNRGQTATFTMAASGSSLTYQWHKVSGGVVGGNSNTLTITNAQTSNAGSYYVTVSNGGGSVNSNTVTLTVIVPPAITTQPVSRTVTQGSTVTFTVAASGTAPFTYQWYYGATPIGTSISSYSIPSAQPSDVGNYSVVVTNAAGNATSNTVTLTVNVPGGPTINSQPNNTTVSVGGTANFSVGATGVGTLSYQWFHGISPVGTNSATYSIPGVTVGDAGSYTVTVTDTNGSTTSNPATLTVNTGGGGNPVTVSVSAITLGAPTGSTTPVSTTVTITNTSAGSITVTPTSSVTFVTTSGAVTIAAGTTVTVTITGNPNGLNGVNSGTITFTNSTGGTQTIPVSFTIGTTTGQRKRSCAIGQTTNPDMLMWVFGLVTLAGLTVAMRRQN